MTEREIPMSIVVTVESLANNLAYYCTAKELLDLILQIDSKVQDWSFTRDLIEKLQEALP